MKLIFIGTSEFAIPSLEKIFNSNHKILCCITQPDRLKGRHLKLHPPPVKEKAIKLGVEEIYQPENINSEQVKNYIKNFNVDIFVVVSYGQILKKEILNIPNFFAINLHASLLPELRGACPVNWAIINGNSKTGVSVIKMTEKMDAGDIILQKEVPIFPDEDAISLNKRLSKIGAEVLLEAIDLIEKDSAEFKSQDENQVSFAPKLKKQDGLIDWSNSCYEIHNKVRGMLPWPGAYTYYRDKLLKIYKSKLTDDKDKKFSGKAGEIVEVDEDKGIRVKCGKDTLFIEKLQLEGGKMMNFKDFIHGHSLKEGDMLG